MKDFQRFAQTMFAMNLILKGFDFSKETPEVGEKLWQVVLDGYWETLKKHDDDLVHKALSVGFGKRWKFFPKPCEINEVIDEIKHDNWLAVKEQKVRLRLLEDGQSKIEKVDIGKMPEDLRVIMNRVVEKHNMALALKLETEKAKQLKAAGEGK